MRSAGTRLLRPQLLQRTYTTAVPLPVQDTRLATARTGLLRCTCSPQRRSYASSPPPAHDTLLVAARKLIDQGNEAQDGGIEANKRKRELEELQRALADVEEGQEVSHQLVQLYCSSRAAPQLLATLEALSTTDPDQDLRDLALSDLPMVTSTLASQRASLLSLLLPPAPSPSLAAILEVKSGVGGSESALFAASLVRMYTRMAVRKGWKAVLVESIGLPGVGMGTGEAYREAMLEVTGEGAYRALRKEAGVHRVQRVPATDSQGRVHTSTVGIIVCFLFSIFRGLN
jgi:peptide chain release factor 1